MPTVLLTGANRGIGLEFARQYAAAGWRVLATCRAPEKAEKLSALGDGVSLYELDVTDHARIKALAEELEGEAIDLLINNAGLYGAAQSQELGSIDPELWIEVLRVNTLAPLKMAECFLPHLKTGERKVIASISSRMGSIGDNDVGGALHLPLEQGRAQRGGEEPRHRPQALGRHGGRVASRHHCRRCFPSGW